MLSYKMLFQKLLVYKSKTLTLARDVKLLLFYQPQQVVSSGLLVAKRLPKSTGSWRVLVCHPLASEIIGTWATVGSSVH